MQIEYIHRIHPCALIKHNAILDFCRETQMRQNRSIGRQPVSRDNLPDHWHKSHIQTKLCVSNPTPSRNERLQPIFAFERRKAHCKIYFFAFVVVVFLALNKGEEGKDKRSLMVIPYQSPQNPLDLGCSIRPCSLGSWCGVCGTCCCCCC